MPANKQCIIISNEQLKRRELGLSYLLYHPPLVALGLPLLIHFVTTKLLAGCVGQELGMRRHPHTLVYGYGIALQRPFQL
jgi:hypothetical protein